MARELGHQVVPSQELWKATAARAVSSSSDRPRELANLIFSADSAMSLCPWRDRHCGSNAETKRSTGFQPRGPFCICLARELSLLAQQANQFNCSDAVSTL